LAREVGHHLTIERLQNYIAAAAVEQPAMAVMSKLGQALPRRTNLIVPHDTPAPITRTGGVWVERPTLLTKRSDPA
jgi:hypothetical protein